MHGQITNDKIVLLGSLCTLMAGAFCHMGLYTSIIRAVMCLCDLVNKHTHHGHLNPCLEIQQFCLTKWISQMQMPRTHPKHL